MKSTEKGKARSKDIKAGEPNLSVIRPTAATTSKRNVAAHCVGDSLAMAAQIISPAYCLLTQSLPSIVIP